MKIENVNVEMLQPYINNPRKNDKAVDPLVKSIKQCGYCAPIIVDEEYVILAGHTRFKAIKKLGWTTVDVIVKEGLTEDQKIKYRLLDNKVGEAAGWDLDKLETEIAELDFEDLELDWGLGDEVADTEFVNTEYGIDSFDDKKFKYECPCCGFRFNKGAKV